MSSFVSSFQQLHVTEIERTPEILADLNGLTMDKKDMLSKTYKYPVEQFQKFELRSRQNRCIDCYVIMNSSDAMRRTRPATQAEKEEERRLRTRLFDFWPEGKAKPMVITSGGSIILSTDSRERNGIIYRKDFPEIDQKIAQYYEPGEYEKAMRSKPRCKIEATPENRGSEIPPWSETPLLGEHMDPNRPCYIKSGRNVNRDLMEWWDYDEPLTWREYLENSREISTVRKAKCVGHPGAVGIDQRWTCCGRFPDSQGCFLANHHRFLDVDEDEERERWTLFPTPDPCVATDPRTAVALSCEAGIATNGDHEVVRIGLVDFFTGEVLINTLVYPSDDLDMLHLNTRWSGVDWNKLQCAQRGDNVLEGRDAARKRVWDFVGPQTIVITYAGGTRDLLCLRMIHRRVIDIQELESRRNKKVRINLWKSGDLRKLVPEHLKRKFPNGSNGNVVEAANALRDLTSFYMKDLPLVMKRKIERWPKPTEEEIRKAAELERLNQLNPNPFYSPDNRDPDRRLILLHNVPREGNEPRRRDDDGEEFWDPNEDPEPRAFDENTLWV